MESKSYLALAPEMLANVDPNSSYALVRDMVGSGQRVLDIGCGPGNLAKILQQAGNAVVGIDADPTSLRAARDACERTISADLDGVDLTAAVGDDRFDVVVFADVLEHLRNPVRLLAASKDVLRERGCIVVSIPNVAHGAVRLALLRGRFQYQQLGILDDTHLRFYTRDSVERLLSECGFVPTVVKRTTAPIFETSDLVPCVRREDFDPSVVADVLADPDAETLQFVICATPVDHQALVAALRANIAEHDQTIRALHAQLAQARAAYDATLPEQLQNATRHAEALSARIAEVEIDYAHARAESEAAQAQLQRVQAAADETRREIDDVRAELGRTKSLAHDLSAERDRALALAESTAAAAAARVAAAEAEYTNAMAGAQRELDRARADLAGADAAADDLRRLHDEALAEMRVLYVARDGAVNDLETARAAHEAEMLAAAAERRDLERRIRSFEDALAIERATRVDVADALDRLGKIALQSAGRQRADELAALRARSETADARVRTARAAARDAVRLPPPPRRAAVPCGVYAGAGVRRSVLVLGDDPPRSRWQRVARALRLLPTPR